VAVAGRRSTAAGRRKPGAADAAEELGRDIIIHQATTPGTLALATARRHRRAAFWAFRLVPARRLARRGRLGSLPAPAARRRPLRALHRAGAPRARRSRGAETAPAAGDRAAFYDALPAP
jgi:hypothetical protein